MTTERQPRRPGEYKSSSSGRYLLSSYSTQGLPISQNEWDSCAWLSSVCAASFKNSSRSDYDPRRPWSGIPIAKNQKSDFESDMTVFSKVLVEQTMFRLFPAWRIHERFWLHRVMPSFCANSFNTSPTPPKHRKPKLKAYIDMAARSLITHPPVPPEILSKTDPQKPTPIRSLPAELLGGDLRTRCNCSEPVLSPGASTRWLDQGGERAARRHMRMCVFLRLLTPRFCGWMVMVWVVWGGCRCGRVGILYAASQSIERVVHE